MTTLAITLQVKIMMFVVAATFFFIYGTIVFNRYRYLKKIDFITSSGVGVMTGGYKIDHASVEAIVKTTISQWKAVTKWGRVAEAVYGTVVVFHTPPLVLNGITYHGYTVNNTCNVSHENDDLNYTAMSHEIGHVIYNNWTNTYLNDAAHKFMADNKLP